MSNINLEETFMLACQNEDMDTVRCCIQLGVNVNYTDEDDLTGLGITILKGNIELFNILLSHPQIDVNMAGGDHSNYLFPLCHFGHTEMIRRLLSVPGIDVNIQNNDGTTAAMVAVYDNHIDIVKILREDDRVNWNLQSQDGGTAALLAVVVASRGLGCEMLRLLKDIPSIDWNLKQQQEQGNGDSPLSLALRKGSMEAAKIILSVPGLEVDTNQLRRRNIPRDMIMECMKVMIENINRANSNLKKLKDCLGDGGSMECPVCLVPFTAQRRVFQCGNGHFTCGTCKGNIQNNNCPRCRGNFIGRVHDFESMLNNNN